MVLTSHLWLGLPAEKLVLGIRSREAENPTALERRDVDRPIRTMELKASVLHCPVPCGTWKGDVLAEVALKRTGSSMRSAARCDLGHDVTKQNAISSPPEFALSPTQPSRQDSNAVRKVSYFLHPLRA